MKRESGYYWVKETSTGPWLISYYEESDERWYFINDADKYESEHFFDIKKERILPPNT